MRGCSVLPLNPTLPDCARERRAGRQRSAFEDCYEEAIRPQLRRLVGVARGILGCEDLAWDAVQTSLVTLWRQEAFPRNPHGWLQQAVRNRSLHLLRTRSR